MATILTIEDDAAIRRGIVDALRFAGYAALEAGRGDQGLEMALSQPCDLVLLDLVLPGRDGLELLGELRRLRPQVPIIILTARGDESDRVRGLHGGADDYVVKPFSVKELLARVEAVLRRTRQEADPAELIAIPGGQIDLARREVRFQDGQATELSERETELLRYLAAHRGRAIDRDEILAGVWQMNPQGISTRTIDMHVARLREKLRDGPEQPSILLTVRGKGYKFALEPGE
jgi:DNA-binding response OmpR family regulator